METFDLSSYQPTIGEIAARDAKSAELFRKFGIDFCCHGEKTLEEACEAVGICEEVFDEYYNKPGEMKDEAYEFWRWETAFLVDYIINTHHYYLKQLSESLPLLAQQTAARHSEDYPALHELAERLKYFFKNLTDQMEKEENVLFPLIKKLAAAKGKNCCSVAAGETVPTVLRLIAEMEGENRSAGDELKFFRNLTSNYGLPLDSDDPYASLFLRLLALEQDLVQHVHLENNILFQKTAALSDGAITARR